MENERILFLISPIGPHDSEIRKYFDKTRKHIIEKITEKKGYKIIRADDISIPGTITKQIIKMLINSELVIADLSKENPNVFYELAIRHAVKKPVILMSEIGQKLPFDVASQRVIQYDHDPDNIEKAKKELEMQISYTESDAHLTDSPVTDTLFDYENGKEQLNPSENRNYFINTVKSINEKLFNIENYISQIDNKDSNYIKETWNERAKLGKIFFQKLKYMVKNRYMSGTSIPINMITFIDFLEERKSNIIYYDKDMLMFWIKYKNINYYTNF